MPTPTLKEEMKDWQDFDGAMHIIAKSLGLFANQKKEVSWFAMKPIYWSRTPVSEPLSHMLTSLTEMGALEHDEAKDKWRWNPNFVMIPDEEA